MSEVKTLKCDECGRVLPTNAKGESLGFTRSVMNLSIDLHYQGLEHDIPKNDVMRYSSPVAMDFCQLECLTSWVAFKITNHFISHCEGETNESMVDNKTAG
jgi:hypothetical protein